MGINCHLKNEAQEDIQVVGDAKGILSSLVLRGAFEKSHVLKYLDPFGDMILNAAQMAVAEEEIARVLETDLTREEEAHLRKLHNLFAQTSRRCTHRYMWFTGD